jgi:hypothetical protein
MDSHEKIKTPRTNIIISSPKAPIKQRCPKPDPETPTKILNFDDDNIDEST